MNNAKQGNNNVKKNQQDIHARAKKKNRQVTGIYCIKNKLKKYVKVKEW